MSKAEEDDGGDGWARHLLRGGESEGSAGLSESQSAFVCYQGSPDYRHTHTSIQIQTKDNHFTYFQNQILNM